jgi:hypothetical protein
MVRKEKVVVIAVALILLGFAGTSFAKQWGVI